MMSDEENLEQYGQAVATTSTPGGRCWCGVVESVEYLAILVIADRVVGARRLGIHCEADPA